MTVKVHVPNKGYQGVIADVRFHNGVGEFEDEKLAKAIAAEYGYEVVSEKPVKSAPKKRATRKPKDGE